MKKILTICGIITFLSTYAQKVELTFFQLNDVYEMSAVNGGKLGGLARIATILDSLREDNVHTYSVLAGDLLSPSAIGTAIYQDEKLAGKQMVDVLNHIDWDYFVLGNHEFDLVEADLRSRLKEMEFTTISDNVTDLNGQLFPNCTTAIIKEVKGIRIGFMGITLNSFKTDYAKIEDPLKKANQVAKQLKDKGCDIIIAISHQSISQDIAMAEEIPEIDMIMGGHEHENYHLMRGDHFTPITKADANAKSAYIHHLTFDKETEKLAIVSEFMMVDSSVKSDPDIQKVVDKWTEIAFESFREQGYSPEKVICISTEVLDGTEASVRSKSTALCRLITDGFLKAFPKADASLMNGGSIRIDDKLQPGPITEYDIIKISPFGGNVSLVKMKGDVLVKALEQGQQNQGIGSFLHYSNISQQDSNWLIKGQKIEKDRTYSIAISSYLVEKGDQNLGFITYQSGGSKKTETNSQEFFKVVIDQFQREFPTPKK